MKIPNTLRTLVATCAFAAAAHSTATPILLVDSNGILTGAQNVDVAGALYNVTFADGSCDSLYNKCDASAFAFNTHEAAGEAARALLSQVFVNGPFGQFDSKPYNIFGCIDPDVCRTFIPYARATGDFYDTNPIGSFYWRFSFNDPTPNDLRRVGDGEASTNYDSTNHPFFSNTSRSNFAVFTLATPAADVPEPSSIALFGLVMAGLAFNRRRKA